MHVLKCDLCKKEIKKPAELANLKCENEAGIVNLNLALQKVDKPEICEPCRNQLIRKLIKGKFPADG